MDELATWLLPLGVIVVIIASTIDNLIILGVGLLMMAISIVLRVIVCERD